MRNNDPTISQARAPRGMVKINGEIMPGWIDWEVDNNAFYQADTARVRFAMSSMDKQHGADWWSRQIEIYVEILAGFPKDPTRFDATELDSLFYGKADEVHYDPVDRGIELTCRDLTSVFIDAKTTEKWQNLTASQIAEQLAARHGLVPKVDPTKTKAGTYYEIDQARLTDERSEWDLLTYLAHEEGYIVYLKGKELHFEPRRVIESTTTIIDNRPAIQKEIDEIKAAWSASLKKSQALLDAASADWDKSQATKDAALEQKARDELAASKAEREGAIAKYQGRLRELERQLKEPPQVIESGGYYVLQWDDANDARGYPMFPGERITFSRNLTVAKGVVVTVRSWNAKNKKAFSVMYPNHKAKGTAPGQSVPAAQNYFFTIPGLTPEQALQRAQAKHKELTAHEMRMSVTMPADNDLKITDTIKIRGTSSAFDQTYYPESIVRFMSMDEGYEMTVRAKNVSPENQVVI